MDDLSQLKFRQVLKFAQRVHIATIASMVDSKKEFLHAASIPSEVVTRNKDNAMLKRNFAFSVLCIGKKEKRGASVTLSILKLAKIRETSWTAKMSY